MTIEEIRHLAGLARIDVTDTEAATFAADFDEILPYVAQVQAAAANVATEPPHAHSNVLREDIETHAPGAYTEALLSAAPERSGAYVAVKKILKSE